jgi:hypothetical protein
MKRLCFLFVLSLCLASQAFAGTTGKVAGTVIDAKSGESLPGANVVVEGTRLGATTDAEGQFFILGVPPGTFSVTASMVGYGGITKTDVRVKIDQAARLKFELQEQTLEAAEILVVAERPPVELDLTASKQTMTTTDLELSWVNSVEEAVEVQSGVGVRGSIRGGFGVNAAYVIDGVDVRDSNTQSSFVVINTAAIQEMEVLSGGYNAEYGQANDAIINIVTRSARDRWHYNTKARMRPKGKYHWGRNIYSEENVEHRVITKEYFDRNDMGASWNDYWRGQGTEPTAEFNWGKYQEFTTPPENMGGYADRHQYGWEGAAFGPIADNISLLVSGKYLRGVTKWPTVLKYNPEWNLMTKLTFDVTDKTKVTASLNHQGTDNAGELKLSYFSSDDLGGSAGNIPTGGIKTPYVREKWNSNGNTVITGNNSRVMPPQYIRTNSALLKMTHIFSSRTFAELSILHHRLDYDAHYENIDSNPVTFQDQVDKTPAFLEPTWFPSSPISTVTRAWQWPRDQSKGFSNTTKTTFKFEISSQMNEYNQVKVGLSFEPQYINSWVGGQFGSASQPFNKVPNRDYHPWDFAAFVQDQIEAEGMIVNLGLRLDMFNANRRVNYTLWDPYALSTITDGNIAGGLFSFDPDGPLAEKTPTQVVVSPRVGIAHPITASTVLHFMYGHFNQRPGWVQIAGNKAVWNRGAPSDPSVPLPPNYDANPNEDYNYIHWWGEGGNPEIGYEKMIQYEVGFDQDIKGSLGLDVTMYYKDAKDLTKRGFRQGRDFDNGASQGLSVQLFMDPNNPQKQTPQDKFTNRGQWSLQGARLDARGLEFELSTKRWTNAQVQIKYDLSYSSTGAYGPTRLYIPIQQPDGSIKQLGRDRYYGSDENNLEFWNPHNTLKLNALLSTPQDFGPVMGPFKPLSNWFMNLHYTYASPQKFTYHPPGDTSSDPLNQSWKSFQRTNMRLSKRFGMPGGTRGEFAMDVHNLFNKKQLILFSGQDLFNFMEKGEMPVVRATYLNPDGSSAEFVEENEWTIYRADLQPRELFFSLSFNY